MAEYKIGGFRKQRIPPFFEDAPRVLYGFEKTAKTLGTSENGSVRPG